MSELSSSRLTVTYFNLKLITNDEDDNKFVDCAFTANADYIVSNDRDFKVIKQLSFPAIKVVTIEEFRNILVTQAIIA